MERPSWDELFIMIATLVSKRSTCLRMQAGSVLTKDNRIISIGYNGSASGIQHCGDYWKEQWKQEYQDVFSSFSSFIESDVFYDKHHYWSNRHELHAEQNAILYAAKTGISTNNSAMYITHSPCIHCAKAISQAGIQRVVYYNKYERDISGIEFLKENDITCNQVDIPSGGLL